MADKIRVGVLGATGVVGQNYILLLDRHPWFDVTCVGALTRSATKSYIEAVGNNWHKPGEIPKKCFSINCL